MLWKLILRAPALTLVVLLVLGAACGDEGETPESREPTASETATAGCPPPGQGKDKLSFRFGATPCLRWEDAYSDETGFQVSVSNANGLVLTQQEPPGAEEAAFNSALTPCPGGRLTVEVVALRPHGPLLVGSITVQSEC